MHAGPPANRVIQRAEELAAQIEASARSTAAKVNDHGLAVHRLQPLLEVRHQILGDQSHRRAAARAQRQRRLLLNLQNRRHSPAAISLHSAHLRDATTCPWSRSFYHPEVLGHQQLSTRWYTRVPTDASGHRWPRRTDERLKKGAGGESATVKPVALPS
jgi:hypothetical protein